MSSHNMRILFQVEKAMENEMVVGSQARILYSNQAGRSRMAAEFNKAVASGELSGPVVSSQLPIEICFNEGKFTIKKYIVQQKAKVYC